MKAWRRSEPRLVRPFFAVASIDGALDGAKVMLGDREVESEEDVIQLDPADFEGLRLSITPNLDEDKMREVLADHVGEVSLTMMIRDPMFKRRLVKGPWPLAGKLPDRIDIDEGDVSAYGHRREMHVTFALLLNAPIDEKPGWPDRRGAWFAKRTFKVNLKGVVSTFDLREMTPEQAKDWTGFPGALVYVDYNDGRIVKEPDDELPLATCYVAKEVYEAMQRPKDGAILQDLVMTEVICSMLTAAQDDILEAQSVPKNSPLERIMDSLGGNETISLDSLQNIVKCSNRIRAAVHDRTTFVDLLRNF